MAILGGADESDGKYDEELEVETQPEPRKKHRKNVDKLEDEEALALRLLQGA